jgi:hypothetical protein
MVGGIYLCNARGIDHAISRESLFRRCFIRYRALSCKSNLWWVLYDHECPIYRTASSSYVGTRSGDCVCSLSSGIYGVQCVPYTRRWCFFTRRVRADLRPVLFRPACLRARFSCFTVWCLRRPPVVPFVAGVSICLF